MERVPRDIECGDLRVADLDAFRVAARVQLASHRQAGCGRGGRDQLDHCLAAGQRPSSPGLGDVAEQSVFDLVPFRGSWRVVAHL